MHVNLNSAGTAVVTRDDCAIAIDARIWCLFKVEKDWISAAKVVVGADVWV